MGPGEDALAAQMRAVAGALPGGGEERPGQLEMARAVSRSVSLERHVVVRAGTGTGKSLAYLLPVVLSGRKAVVATATRNLQDQLAGKDLPLLSKALGARHSFRFAVLKGRSNYLCRQRVSELSEPALPVDELTEGAPGDMGDMGDVGAVGRQVRRLVEWAQSTDSGERAELPFEPDPRAWAAVSVSAHECPGVFRCPSGPDCFAELARTRAASADVVVVNSHLYAAHVASGGAVLPEHEVVVFDEAHAVEDVMTAGLGLELTPGRLRAAAQASRGLIDPADPAPAEALSTAADRLDVVLVPLVGRRVLGPGRRPGELAAADDLAGVLELAAGRVSTLMGALRRAAPSSADSGDGAVGSDPDTEARRTRAVLACTHLLEDLTELSGLGADSVAWVEATGPQGRWRTLRAAPVDVGGILAEQLWPSVTGVLTSATVPPHLGASLGLPAQASDELDVGSPFPYRSNSLLYCPVHLPDRRSPGAEPALHQELRSLIEAAGGRTLALFTSWRAMRNAVDALRPVLALPVLAQNDLPKPALLEAFAVDEAACLFATMSFWQGVDVPGRTLSLVAIDRLPFPRPDDPLLEARRERAGNSAFSDVDLPRAATLLAQGAGRLIRSSSDRGVVAVLDRRLATAGYGPVLRSVLPPMPFTTERHQALAFLGEIVQVGPAGQ